MASHWTYSDCSASGGMVRDKMWLWGGAALSVAAALQRMRTHPQQDTAKGLILLEAAELTRWAHTLRRYAPSPPPNTHTTPHPPPHHLTNFPHLNAQHTHQSNWPAPLT